MKATRKPRMPNGLGTAGKKLWTDVVAEFDLSADPHKLRILFDACKVADYITRLDDAAASGPETVRGSMGQPVVNPMIDRAITSRGQLAQLLDKLNFKATEGD